MPDQVQNTNPNLQAQGLPPVTPPDPPAPSAPSDGAPPPPPVEPVPLPKAASAEAPPPPPPPHPLFEKPVTVAPKAKDEGRSPPAGEAGTKAEGHLKFPKGVIAGIAALVFLVVGLGSGLYLVGQKQDIRPFALTWEEQMKKDSATTDRFVDTWGSVEEGKKQWERERALFEATGGQQNDGLWGGAKDQQTVQEFWDSGVNNKQTPKEEREEVVTAAQQAAEQAKQQGASAAEAAAAAKAAVKEVGAPGVSPPGGTGVVGGNAGACYGLGDDPSDSRNNSLERDCLANSPTGEYKSGLCIGKSIAECLATAGENASVEYCSGAQQAAGSPRAGEFLECGKSSTDGCGQADIKNAKGELVGFIIDKSNCAAAPPPVTTEEAPPREFPPEEPPPPGATATPTPVTVNAFCSSLVGQISDGAGGWVTKTDAEFSATARPGDRVRFVCTGAKNRGRFTKSAFFINSVLHIDDVVKLAEDQYSVEYTIPAAGALKVESVLLHDSKGWVD